MVLTRAARARSVRLDDPVTFWRPHAWRPPARAV